MTWLADAQAFASSVADTAADVTQQVTDKPFATTTVGQIVIPAIAAALGALLLAAGKYVPKLFRELREFREFVTRRLAEQDVKVDQQNVKLDAIEHETHTNTGSSLKDAALRTEGRVTAISEKLDEHLYDAAYQKTRLDRLLDQGTVQAVQVNVPPPQHVPPPPRRSRPRPN